MSCKTSPSPSNYEIAVSRESISFRVAAVVLFAVVSLLLAAYFLFAASVHVGALVPSAVTVGGALLVQGGALLVRIRGGALLVRARGGALLVCSAAICSVHVAAAVRFAWAVCSAETVAHPLRFARDRSPSNHHTSKCPCGIC